MTKEAGKIFFKHLDGADEDLAVDAVVDSDGVAPVEEVDVRVVAVLDLELLTADRSRLSSSLAVNQPGGSLCSHFLSDPGSINAWPCE